MIQNQKVLGLITARGGSKGVPGKNIRIVNGKPLLAYTIEAAKKSRYIDRIILSSDDDGIMEVAKRYGCEVPFKREASLATDESSSVDVALDAIQLCPGFGWIVLLQPTSPLRTSDDIDETIKKCIDLNAKSSVTVTEAEHSPYWMYHLESDRLVSVIDKPLIGRRQDLPKAFRLNGCVYVTQVDWFLQTKSFISKDTVAYEMPVNRSLDIDTEDDFVFLDYILRGKV